MSTIQVKKCPKCGTVYERNSYAHRPSKDNRTKYGSPLKMCRTCKTVFKDDEYRELAIEGARDVDRSVVSPYGILMGVVALAATVSALWIGSLGMAVFFLVLIGFTPFTEAVSYKKRQYELDLETVESKKRLLNPVYAASLQQVGYSVPNMYLSDTDLNTRQEKISKLEEEEKSLRDKIKAVSKKNNIIYLITIAVIAGAAFGYHQMKKSAGEDLAKWQEVMNSEDLFEVSETAGDKYVVYEQERKPITTEYSYQKHYLPKKEVASEPSEAGYICVVEYTFLQVGEYKTTGLGLGTPAYRVYTTVKLYDRHTGSYFDDSEQLEGGEPPSSKSVGGKNYGSISSDSEIRAAIEALISRNIDQGSEKGSEANSK